MNRKISTFEGSQPMPFVLLVEVCLREGRVWKVETFGINFDITFGSAACF
jgi:hypothetical protein